MIRNLRPRFTDDALVELGRTVTRASGALTVEVRIGNDDAISRPFLGPLHVLGQAIARN
jgi:hypothetical protein